MLTDSCSTTIDYLQSITLNRAGYHGIEQIQNIRFTGQPKQGETIELDIIKLK